MTPGPLKTYICPKAQPEALYPSPKTEHQSAGTFKISTASTVIAQEDLPSLRGWGEGCFFGTPGTY